MAFPAMSAGQPIRDMAVPAMSRGSDPTRKGQVPHSGHEPAGCPADHRAVTPTAVTPSVLLVDDDAVALSRFRQHLRAWESEWDMTFALGAKEALEALDSTAFDVVVSDVQTRGLNGESLLEAVQARHGSLVRVALARHPGEEAALRASAVAHRFLTKPLDDDELRTVVERASELRAALRSDELRHAVTASARCRRRRPSTSG
jgi:DNA-binding NtrC family response regulator